MQRHSSTGLRYLPGLDGLRAFAVLAVIFYHSGLQWLPGGFVGVEVFFVISGYIITAGLRREHGNGGISLPHFWKRRALRLLPAVMLLLFCVVLYAEVFEPDRVAGLGRDSIAALSYSTNWYLIVDGQSYFDSFQAPSMLRHLWSLAIEEQFYVVWPLVAFAGLRWLPRRPFACVCVLGAVASAGAMWLLFQEGASASRLYYGTDTRASGLLLGASLALLWQPGVGGTIRRYRLFGLELLGVAALVALGVVCFRISDSTPWLYRGGFFAVDALTVVAIVAAVHPALRLGRIISIGPLRWVGLRSYGLYLWHWPIILVFEPRFDWSGGAEVEFLIELALTMLVTEASYRWLEQPIRKGAIGRTWNRLKEGGRSPSFANVARVYGVVGIIAAVATVGGVAAAADGPEVPDYFALGQIHITPDGAEQTTSVSGVSYDSSGSANGITDAEMLEHLSLTMRQLYEQAQREREEATATAASPTPASDETPAPTPTPTPEPSSATQAGVYVTAVGDSVMLGAAREMGAEVAGLDVDAQVSRSLGAGIAILQDRKDRGILADTVVLHMGNNGPIDDEQMEEVANIVDGRRTIIFSLRVPRYWEEENNAVLKRAVARHSNFELLDWEAASGERPDVLWTDGIHLRPEGALYYTSLLKEMLDNPPTPPDPVLSEIELPPGSVWP